MKYSELIRLVRMSGCRPLNKDMNGHPLWINPKTGMLFKMSHHKAQEVAAGTCKAILNAAGIKRK